MTNSSPVALVFDSSRGIGVACIDALAKASWVHGQIVQPNGGFV